jgi:hypothetical protein
MEKAWEAGLQAAKPALPAEAISAGEALAMGSEDTLFLWKKRGKRGCKPLSRLCLRGASALGKHLRWDLKTRYLYGESVGSRTTILYPFLMIGAHLQRGMIHGEDEEASDVEKKKCAKRNRMGNLGIEIGKY